MTNDDPIPLDIELDVELDWRKSERVFDIGDTEDAARWLDHVAGHPDTSPELRAILTALVVVTDKLRDQQHAQDEIVRLLKEHNQ